MKAEVMTSDDLIMRTSDLVRYHMYSSATTALPTPAKKICRNGLK